MLAVGAGSPGRNSRPRYPRWEPKGKQGLGEGKASGLPDSCLWKGPTGALGTPGSRSKYNCKVSANTRSEEAGKGKTHHHTSTEAQVPLTSRHETGRSKAHTPPRLITGIVKTMQIPIGWLQDADKQRHKAELSQLLRGPLHQWLLCAASLTARHSF